MNLKTYIRDVPDFPKKGIIFKDITPLLQNKKSFNQTIDTFYRHYKNKKIDVIVGIESRGFIFGAPLAYKLRCSFVPVRKLGKLPYKTIKHKYALEYGTNTIELHEDSIKKGDRVLIIDDLLATAGTALATTKLVEVLGGNVIELGFLIELSFLKGRKKLKDYSVFSIINYPE